MKKIIYVVYTAIALLLVSSVMAVSGDVTRSVSNANPSFGDIVTVTLTVTLTDTDGSPTNQWFSIREPKPTWTFTYGNFQPDASEPTIISVIKLDQSAGTKTYTYTVTAPSTASTLSFSGGQYKVGEGQQESAFTSTGGTSSLSVGGGGPPGGNGTTTGTSDNTMLYVIGGGLGLLVLFFVMKKK